jgi:hypothetical protein
MRGYERIDFGKVLEVLEGKRYVHGEGKIVDACFNGWNVDIDLDNYEEVLAYLIRIVLMDEVIRFVKRLEGEECDIRDILLFLVVMGMGLGLLSQVVEAAEKGLRVLYDEKEYKILSICLEIILKNLEEKLGKIEKEVMLQ